MSGRLGARFAVIGSAACAMVGCRATGNGVGPGSTAVAAATPSVVAAHPGIAGPSGAGSRVTTARESSRSPLRSPFDVEARRALVGRPMSDPGAPTTDPIRDVRGVSFYVDDERSIADPRLKEQNLAALKPLRDFVLGVVKLADAWMQSNPPQLRYAATAVQALSSWAAAGALLGSVNHQGAYEREWTLGSLALAYLKVRDAPGLDPARRAAIEAWFKQIAATIQPDYPAPDPARPPSARPGRTSIANNHAYWAGMAVAAAGLAGNDRPLFQWGLDRARIGIAQVDPDGTLPLERSRRALALHYHVFALAPLVMLAEMASANGVDLYDEGGGAIRRLAVRVMDAFTDPTAFADRVGSPQEIRLPPSKTDLAWAEAYGARYPDARLRSWLTAARPLFDVRLGGDTTAAFALPASYPQQHPQP